MPNETGGAFPARKSRTLNFDRGVIFSAYHSMLAHSEEQIARELLEHIGIETVQQLIDAGGQDCDVEVLSHLLLPLPPAPKGEGDE